MSCILRVIGEDFDVDGFLEQSGITPEAIFYKGQPKLRTKPDGPKRKYSGCSLPANDADFGDFNKQVEDVVNFLTTNYSKLKHINSTPGIQFASLDFGITYDFDKWVQSKYMPLELVKLCGELGLGIEISIYQPSEGD